MQRLLDKRQEATDWNSYTAQECLDCGCKDFIEDARTGDIICSGCGCVKSEKLIDHGKEWRSFTALEEKRRARTGLPVTEMIYDKGLPTRIGRLRRGSPGQIEMAERLRRTNLRNVGNNIERNLKKAFAIMKIICEKMKIGDNAKKEGVKLYRRAVENKLSRGRPMDALICACLFYASKKDEKPRPLGDFFHFADERQIKNCITLLVEELGIKLIPSSPKDFINQFADKGVISEVARLKAYKILNALETIGALPSKDPRGFAAASLYIGCRATPEDKRQTQRDLAVYADVTEVTVRKRIKYIRNKLILIMPK